MWVWVAPIAALSALALAFFFYYHSPRARHHGLSITAGSFQSTRHQLSQVLQRNVSGLGLELDPRETAGSEEALDLVNAHTLDLAFVQGGLRVDGRPNVRQVATLNMEPLHLLVKTELAEKVTAHLTALDGKTVNLGAVGSGTHSLAIEVLRFAGLHPQEPGRSGGYVGTAMSRHDFASIKDRTGWPDAIFLVSSLPSETAKVLVHEHDYRLVPLAFGEAFSLDALNGTDSSHGHRRSMVEKGRIGATTIPAFVYQVEPPVPAVPLPALGTRLLLVAHRDVNVEAVRRLVDAVYSTEFASASRPPLDVKLLDLPPELPWHEGTRIYLERNTPVVSGVLMDSAHKGFAILAAAASGLFVLWQWLKQRNRFLRDRGFNKYISEVTRIEEKAAHLEHRSAGSRQELLALRDELARLKTEALDLFTKGDLAGHELLQGFLVQVNDVRDYVTRLASEAGDTPGPMQATTPASNTPVHLDRSC
jgi:TRAP-type uncharacterized transport system substrate-binding protein